MAADWIDTHAHLDDPAFAEDLSQVLQRAKAAGVRCVITIGTTAATSRRAVELAGTYAELFAAVGIQPNHVSEAQAGDWDRIMALLRQRKVVALGETGLDRYWDFSPFAQQQEYFARHLEEAAKAGLPVVIHCREAFAETVAMLREHFDRHGPIRGVMHSFTGDWPTAEACLQMGLHLSFAGMLTYKNAEPLRQVAAKVPWDRLLVETDSPYLVPVPLRGKVRRNEPAHVPLTGACLASLHDMTPEQLAEITTANARRLFGLD
ncbi:MAG: TatD family hydrolase [Gemmatales bacterium]|nr:TatD family hydrolase [Gemmatales bacterium]MDW8385539.1 TatD family hydrolase [Gemmatales bacterium]